MPLRDIHNYKGHEMGTREDGKIVIAAYDREFPTLDAAHAWVDQHVAEEAKKSDAPFSVLDLVKGTAAHRSAFNLTKAKYVRRTGTPGNYKYEYADEKKPGHTSTTSRFAPDPKEDAKHPAMGKWSKNPQGGRSHIFDTEHGRYQIDKHPQHDGHTSRYIPRDANGDLDRGNTQFLNHDGTHDRKPHGSDYEPGRNFRHTEEEAKRAAGNHHVDRNHRAQKSAPATAPITGYRMGSVTYVESPAYELPDGGQVRRPGLDPVMRAQPPVIDDGRDPYVSELARLSGRLIDPGHGILAHVHRHSTDSSEG
jgi:hypothetical protein